MRRCRLDWRVLAKTERYYIKEYEEETNLKAFLLVDASGSMGYRGKTQSKFEYAQHVAACLAYLMLHQLDAVGLVTHDTKVRQIIPPRASSKHLLQLFHALDQTQPGGETSMAPLWHELAGQFKRRGLVVLISDLIDDPVETLKSIRLLSNHRHDVVVFHVQDATELDFSFEGPGLFKDLETGEELEIDPASVRATYLEQMRELCDYYRKGLTDVGIDYHPINTRQPYDQALSAYLARRAKTRK